MICAERSVMFERAYWGPDGVFGLMADTDTGREKYRDRARRRNDVITLAWANGGLDEIDFDSTEATVRTRDSPAAREE